MKKILLMLQIALLVIYTGTAQQKSGLIKNYQSQKTDTDSKMFPIPGSHILNKYWKQDLAKLRANKKSISDKSALQKINKTEWNFTVGQAYEWWATDMTNPNDPSEYKVPSTCRVKGNNCYIFVEDQLWNTRVTQAAVDSIKAAWELRTPADASKGIYQLNVEHFGNPPDEDGDPKIIILILDIIDGSTSGGYIAGFFNPINEFTEFEVQQFYGIGSDRHSNYAEIYYIDGNQSNLTTQSGITSASSTTAHEFQHMIFFNYDEINKETFINEGMSEVASKLCGYDLNDPAAYFSNTNVDFFPWGVTDDIFDDYSRAATFSWYLVEQLGNDVTKYIVQNQFDGPACYSNAFSVMGSQLNFLDVLKNFALAVQINNTAYDPRYGFTIPISAEMKPSALTHLFPIVPTTADSVMPYGTRYIEFVSGQSISIDVNSAGNIEVKAIATGTAGIKVDNIALGTPYTLSDFGTNYSNLVLAVTNLTNSKTYFTYSATGSGGSGSVELKYDLTEPTGYLQGIGDTVCVWFDGVAGGKIDSIRVALRRAGSISGGIWEYTGNIWPTPIGNKLASLTATVYQTPGIPYPEPWPNWATINLTSSNINASKAFAVAFVNQGNDLTQPRVMVTESPLPGEITSFIYTAEDGEWGSTYYAYDSVYTFLIRAYVSIPTSVDNPDVQQMPVSYVLHQNYPNPFNPTTKITFSIPNVGTSFMKSVKLKIYDLLGREVATLVNGITSPGEHTIEWNAQNFPSGVYFYQLKCENGFIDTKKMVLMK